MNRLLVCLVVGALLCLVGWTAHAELTKSSPAAQNWDYDMVQAYTSQMPDKLNQRGAQGWELVTAVCPDGANGPCAYYLKRPR